jgi:hypothetical protein
MSGEQCHRVGKRLSGVLQTLARPAARRVERKNTIEKNEPEKTVDFPLLSQYARSQWRRVSVAVECGDKQSC